MFKVKLAILSTLIFSFIIQKGFSFDKNESVKFLFLGDFYFGESYQTNPALNRGTNVIDEYGYDYMFENIKDLLLSSTLTIANLETTLAGKNSSPISHRKPYVHWADAKRTIKYMKKYNITVLSLANNHTFDYGTEGLKQTTRELKSNGLNFFGAGLNSIEAELPFVKSFTIGDRKINIAVISGFEYRKSYDSLYNFYALGNEGGVNLLDAEKISAKAGKIKEKYKDVFIIVFPHWGKNYQWKNEKQTETAHKLLDCGVDMIIGHGSHMMQEIEKFNGKWIVYGTGNSVFNAPGRYEFYNVKPYSLIAELVIRKEGDVIKKYLRLYPVYTDNLNTEYQIRFLDDDEFIDCYNTLNEKSMNVEEIKLKENSYSNYFEIEIK